MMWNPSSPIWTSFPLAICKLVSLDANQEHFYLGEKVVNEKEYLSAMAEERWKKSMGRNVTDSQYPFSCIQTTLYLVIGSGKGKCKTWIFYLRHIRSYFRCSSYEAAGVARVNFSRDKR